MYVLIKIFAYLPKAEGENHMAVESANTRRQAKTVMTES